MEKNGAKETKKMTAQIEPLLTPEQLAQRLMVSRRFVAVHTTDRRLPGMVRVGRSWRFEPQAVEKAILSGKILAGKQ